MKKPNTSLNLTTWAIIYIAIIVICYYIVHHYSDYEMHAIVMTCMLTILMGAWAIEISAKEIQYQLYLHNKKHDL